MLLKVEPFKCPIFTFGWLELVSCKDFIGAMCKQKLDTESESLYTTRKINTRQLLCKLLHFFKRTFNDSVSHELSILYDGTVKLFMLLVNDYDSIVYENYIDLVYNLPEQFTFLRNIILAAHPNNMKIMDPIVTKKAYENKEIFLSLPIFSTETKFPEEMEHDYKSFLEVGNF